MGLGFIPILCYINTLFALKFISTAFKSIASILWNICLCIFEIVLVTCLYINAFAVFLLLQVTPIITKQDKHSHQYKPLSCEKIAKQSNMHCRPIGIDVQSIAHICILLHMTLDWQKMNITTEFVFSYLFFHIYILHMVIYSLKVELYARKLDSYKFLRQFIFRLLSHPLKSFSRIVFINPM